VIAGAVALLAVALAAAVPPDLRGRDLERLPTARKEVVLTFDAGADAGGLAPILRTLRREGVPATFFLTGRWVERYPAAARTIGATWEVANHTYSHPQLTRLPSLAVTAEIERGERAIRRATGQDPRPLFRFPYGDRDRRTIGLANRSGYICIRWTVDTWGWMGRGRQSRAGVVRRVLAGLQPGAIIMFHVGAARDGSTLDADALPEVIRVIRARGYTFTTFERFRGR
jgi:peptidoglycan-N-acetylglucosamine deacetylase